MTDNLEYELDRTAVTPEFLRGISAEISRILQRGLERKGLAKRRTRTDLGAEAAEEVYVLLRTAVNQGKQKRNEPPLTDAELVARLEEDRDFYVRGLGTALFYYRLSRLF